jgi:hypothetical protein
MTRMNDVSGRTRRRYPPPVQFPLWIACALLLPVGAPGANAPLVQWQKTYGGTNTDNLTYVAPTGDGGYVFCGSSFSGVSGNKTSTNSGDYDCWVFKVDANGDKLWDRCYGGTNTDSCSSIVQSTNDGSLFVIGISFSKASGTKASTNYGGSDGWVLKLDANGNKIWDRSFGGTNLDGLSRAVLRSDGGLLLGGISISGASGSKTSSLIGSFDAWLVRLDASGNPLWDVSLGGTLSDSVTGMQNCRDNGVILAGTSSSSISGTKTSANYGSGDFWLVKLDAAEAVQWDKSFGGSLNDSVASVRQTADNGFLIGGTSSSPVSGNKTSPNLGGDDYWVVRTDSSGNKLWDASFGGSTNDTLRSLELTDDGGCILGGNSLSGISGNKTSPNYGGTDIWIVKLDATGAKQWEMSLGGDQDDDLYQIQPLGGDAYILAGSSHSGISGNKITPQFGPGNDAWIILLAPPLPSLSVAEVANHLVLSWPSPSSGFGLEQSTNLAAASWVGVTNTPADDGTNRSVTLPLDSVRAFYRLRR